MGEFLIGCSGWNYGETPIKAAGQACSISATSDQLNRLPSFIPRINKEFDAVLISPQQHGTYVILYATQHGRMGEFQGMFQNILNSISFGNAGNNIGGNMTSSGGGNMTSPSPNPTNATFQEPALGQNFVLQGTKTSQIDPLRGHANEYVAAVLKPRADGAVYSGVLTYTASNGVNVEIWDAYNPVNGMAVPNTANYNGLPIVLVDLSPSGASGSLPFSGNAVILHATSPFTVTFTVSATSQTSTTNTIATTPATGGNMTAAGGAVGNVTKAGNMTSSANPLAKIGQTLSKMFTPGGI